MHVRIFSSSGTFCTLGAPQLHARQSISGWGRIKANRSLMGFGAALKPGMMQHALAHCTTAVFALAQALLCQLTQSGIGASTLCSPKETESRS